MLQKTLYFFVFLHIIRMQAVGQELQHLKAENDSLQEVIRKIQSYQSTREQALLDKINILLEPEIKDLKIIYKRFRTQRDSLAKLLLYARHNEEKYRISTVRNQAIFTDLQGKYDSLARRYQDLLNGNGSSISELLIQIERLTQERNHLVKENQDLKTEILKITGNTNNNVALFTNAINIVAGNTRMGRFQESLRARETDNIEVAFRLNRVVRPQENLTIKLFDALNQEIPLNLDYRNHLNNIYDFGKEKLWIVPKTYKFVRGSYSLRIYMTDVERNIIENEIGVAEFTLK